MNYDGRLTSGNVGSVVNGSGVVENMGVAFGIFVISRSVPEKHSTSGLQVRHLEMRKSPDLEKYQQCLRGVDRGRKCLGNG